MPTTSGGWLEAARFPKKSPPHPGPLRPEGRRGGVRRAQRARLKRAPLVRRPRRGVVVVVARLVVAARLLGELVASVLLELHRDLVLDQRIGFGEGDALVVLVDRQAVLPLRRRHLPPGLLLGRHLRG